MFARPSSILKFSQKDDLRISSESICAASPPRPRTLQAGASPQQIEEFKVILAGAVDRIIAERLDQTRH